MTQETLKPLRLGTLKTGRGDAGSGWELTVGQASLLLKNLFAGKHTPDEQGGQRGTPPKVEVLIWQ